MSILFDIIDIQYICMNTFQNILNYVRDMQVLQKVKKEKTPVNTLSLL